jgi:predicted nuclease with TOPRIM domain
MDRIKNRILDITYALQDFVTSYEIDEIQSELEELEDRYKKETPKREGLRAEKKLLEEKLTIREQQQYTIGEPNE